MGRGIALLFHDRGTRRGWVVSSTPRPHFTPGKDPVPILQEAGWAPGPVWTGGKSRPHRDSIPDRPARSQSLYRLSYPTKIANTFMVYFTDAPQYRDSATINRLLIFSPSTYHLYFLSTSTSEDFEMLIPKALLMYLLLHSFSLLYPVVVMLKERNNSPV